MTFTPSWWGIIERFRNGGILWFFAFSFAWRLLLLRWVVFFGRLPFWVKWLIMLRRYGVRRYLFGPCCSQYFFQLSIFYPLDLSMPWRVKVYDTSRFLTCFNPIWSYLQININVIAQIIPGTLLPGKPFVNMIFKAYSVQTLAVGTSFVQDLKLGHYVKVPPRSTFMGMWNLACKWILTDVVVQCKW